MKQFRVYVDTSVVGGCFDAPFADASRKLFQMAVDGEIELVLSELLLEELVGAPEQVQRHLTTILKSTIVPIPVSAEAKALRDVYLSHAIVGLSSANDALHVALATIDRADVVASWNFKHLVHLQKIRGFNAINLLMGYDNIEIRSPQELVE